MTETQDHLLALARMRAQDALFACAQDLDIMLTSGCREALTVPSALQLCEQAEQLFQRVPWGADDQPSTQLLRKAELQISFAGEAALHGDVERVARYLTSARCWCAVAQLARLCELT